jgi:hypothetical protein
MNKTVTLSMLEYNQLEEFKKAFQDKSIVKVDDFGNKEEYLSMDKEDVLNDLADQLLKANNKIKMIEDRMFMLSQEIDDYENHVDYLMGRSLWQRILNK